MRFGGTLPKPAAIAARFCVAIGLLSAAAAAVQAAQAQAAPEIPPFSAAKGEGLPAGWEHVPLASYKAVTEYTTTSADGQAALHAVAHGSASLLVTRVDFDPHRYPMLSWRWKILRNIGGADSRDRKREDAPARVMVSFSGDSRKLSFKERATASAAEAISGQPFPYAELMYIWGNKVAVDSLTPSLLSSRIQMIAVGSDDAGVGDWQSYTRNLVDDYKRAFGEEPGNVVAIKVMTDTDNTGGDAEALYGDIRAQAR
jgi:hypothetical protein